MYHSHTTLWYWLVLTLVFAIAPLSYYLILSYLTCAPAIRNSSSSSSRNLGGGSSASRELNGVLAEEKITAFELWREKILGFL